MTNRRLVFLALVVAAACNRGGPTRAEVRELSAALVRHGVEDQSGRAQIASAVMNRDTAFLHRMGKADSARSLWLRGMVAKYGWPSRAMVGDSAAKAAWLILQHTEIAGFQAEMLPRLDSLAARGEMPKQDVALLTDRVRVGQGKGQLYGSQFSLKDGRFVADSIDDLAHLEERRAAIGLPPMTEYTQTLGKMYGVPVVWPPKP